VTAAGAAAAGLAALTARPAATACRMAGFAQAGLGQDAGDLTVARAVPAAAAAVGEDYDPGCVLRYGQVAGQPDLPRGGLHLAAAGSGEVAVPRRPVSSGGRQPGSRCALQAGDHLIVGGLGEIGVEAVRTC